MTLRKTAGALAAFGLVVGLLGSGVGASFFTSLTATENINVGTFSCRIIQPSDGSIASDHQSVTYTAPTINSSAPSSAPFSFTVQNNGSINQVLTVSMTSRAGLSSHFSPMAATPSPVALAASGTQLITTGVQWSELDTGDLGASGSMTWTINCAEGFPIAYYVVNDGGTFLAPGTWVRSTTPIASTAVVGGGTATQSVDGGGHVSLAITGPGSYADNGFYVPLGTLSDLASSGYSVTGTGSDFGTNVYFDVNNNGEFFAWTGNSLSSIDGDAYGLGPTSSGGTLNVTGTSTYALTCNGTYGNYSLNYMAGTGCSPEGITGATKVAVWVGITSTGSALSTTITSAP